MAGGLEIRIDLEENLSDALGRAITAGTDMTPVMQAIANHLAASTKLRFDREAGPSGTPWKPSRRATEDGGKTLTEHGDLKDSIRPDWGKDYAAAGPERSAGAAIYAAIHQFGGTIRPRKAAALSFGGKVFSKVVIPARPYLGVDEADRDHIAEVLREHILGALSGDAAPI